MSEWKFARFFNTIKSWLGDLCRLSTKKKMKKRNGRIFFRPIYTKKVIGRIEKYSIYQNKLIVQNGKWAATGQLADWKSLDLYRINLLGSRRFAYIYIRRMGGMRSFRFTIKFDWEIYAGWPGKKWKKNFEWVKWKSPDLWAAKVCWFIGSWNP